LAIVATNILVHYKPFLLNFFFLPVIFSGYYLGRKRAVMIAISCILLEALYLVFSQQVFGIQLGLSRDDLIFLISWAIFLMLTAWIVGVLSEKREKEVFNLKRAYAGILSIVLKYLEVGEEEIPGRTGFGAGRKDCYCLEINKVEVENIKSAALLSDIPELQNFLPLFTQTTQYMEQKSLAQLQLSDREKILLKTAALILTEIQPLLQSYYVHYRQKAGEMDKSLNSIPAGAAIIALAELYVRMTRQGKVKVGPEEISSLEDLQKLRGRYFPDQVVEALQLVVY